MEHKAIVFIELNGQTVPAGMIRIIEDGRFSEATFAYGKRYLERANAIAIDPVQLPLTDDLIGAPADFSLFNGIRDAAPDAWGRSLIDKYVLRRLNRPAMEAEFLLASQSGTRAGALRFGSNPSGPGQVLPFHLPEFSPSLGDLEQFQALVDQVVRDQAHEAPEPLMDFIAPGSDMGGARPKGTVMIDDFPWLVKFGKEGDRISMASAEAGCLDLCEMAGLEVCERRIETIAGRPALMLKRFDRYLDDAGALHSKHMISSLTLLGAHELDRSASGYADIYDAFRARGGSTSRKIGEEIFRRMVMNVLCGNTDDHYRNHAFLYEDGKGYVPSPVYDVTPSLQVSSSRAMFLHLGRAGSGRNATLEAAVAGAESLGLHRDQAEAIANELSEMVAANWRQVMERRGCSAEDIRMIENSFSEAGKQVALNPDEPSF
ncbi:type II toxin-antitoxin system HipA family toxin [Leisingera sp. XS_AS12]|uniref:type II toxin-antitoxin system HipA family toxin n=1 Tax=Leisingera sp. XS_AS12 TaxID=3241294 RepID=UPI003512C1A1